MRTGHGKIHKLLSTGNWMLIGDVTVDIGTIKCLVTVAVDLNDLEEREDYTIKLEDLEIVGISPTEHSDGEFACEAFKVGIERLGGVDAVKGLVIDQGPDVKKGATLLQKANSKVQVFFDISHKLALVVEKELKDDPRWVEYTSQLAKTKQRVQQTELAALQPPNQRSKARFMNARLYLDWPNKILQSKAAGRLKTISEERYEAYFGWLSTYTHDLDIWSQKIGVVEMMKGVIRENGLSYDAYDFLLTEIAMMALDTAVSEFVLKVFKAVEEEVKKLYDGQVVPAFTEIIETLFGCFKYHSARGGQGITGNVLTIGVLTGATQTEEETCEILEQTPVCKVMEWVNAKLGDTLTKARNKFFNPIKETKFDNTNKVVFV